MPAPTTNRKGQFDASDTDHVWKLASGTAPYHSGVPANGDTCEAWEDDNNLDLMFQAPAGFGPILNLTSPAMALPSLQFNPAVATMSGTLVVETTSGYAHLSDLITASEFVIGLAFRIVSGATNITSGSTWNNESILTSEGANLQIQIRNSAGVVTLGFAHQGATFDVVTIGALALNTNYVALFWRTGGSIFAEVYKASGLTGSGNTASTGSTNMTDKLYIGRGYAAGVFASMYLGEMVFYNAYVAGDRTALTSYLNFKWLGIGGAPPLPTLATMTPNSAAASPSAPVNLIGVAFTGTGLDGAGGAFNAIAGFTFSSLSIAAGGASGTVNIQIATAKAPGIYTFTYTTTGGSSSGTTSPGIAFTVTVLAPPVTLTSMTPNSAYANASVPVKLLGVAFTGTSLDGPSGAFDGGGGFVFTNLVIAAGGASGTVDLQIAAAKAPGNYNFVFTTSAGTSLPLVFTISALAAGDTGGLTRLNAGLN